MPPQPTTRPLAIRPGRMLVLALAAPLATVACEDARPHDLRAVVRWDAPAGGLPARIPLQGGRDAAFVPPADPAPRSGGEVVARTVASTLVYPVVGGLMGIVYCAGITAATAGLGILVCGPLAAAAGLGAAVGEGVAAGSQDIHTAEEVATAAAALRNAIAPAQVSQCLRDTLLSRAGGRLAGAEAGGEATTLRVQLDAITLTAQRDSPMRGTNPPLALNMQVSATLSPEPPAEAAASPPAPAPTPWLTIRRADRPYDSRGKPPSRPGLGTWNWTGEQRRYFASAADAADPVRQDLEIAIGVLAQRILADIFPGAFPAPPTRLADGAAQFRANCPGLARPSALVQTVPAESLAARR